MKQVNQLHLTFSEVDEAIKKYVIEKGYTPKSGSVVIVTHGTLGLTNGVKITLEQENKGENK